MDISGQSLLPLVAIGAMFLPGLTFKLIGGGLTALLLLAFALRLASRRERAEIRHRLAGTASESITYTGRRRAS